MTPTVKRRENEYYSEQQVKLIAANWMRWLPDAVRLSELSIPGTHDTMAVHGHPLVADSAQCQSLPLRDQLRAGIRALDIRVVRVQGEREDGTLTPTYFTITHGPTLQNAWFGADVLAVIAAFLRRSTDDTVFVRVLEDARDTPGGRKHVGWVQDHFPGGRPARLLFAGHTRQSAAEVLQSYLAAPAPDAPTQTYADFAYGWNGTGFTGSANPTLGELRGRMIIVDAGCLGTDGGSIDGLGFPKLNQAPFRIASSGTLPAIGFDKVKWFGSRDSKGVRQALQATAAGSADSIYFNEMNGVGDWDGPYPYMVAGGDELGVHDGQNALAFDYFLGGNQQRTTGIVMMDFPGAGLIAQIIAHNFWHSTFPQYKDDLKVLTHQVVFGADRGQPGDSGEQARDRGSHFVTFLRHVVRDRQLNVIALKDRWESHWMFSGEPREYQELTHHVEGMNYWVWAPRSLSSEVDMGSDEFVARLNAGVSGLGGLRGAVARTQALLNAAETAYPGQDWVAFVKKGDGGFENWFFSVAGAHQRVDRGGYQHLLFGESRNDLREARAAGPI